MSSSSSRGQRFSLTQVLHPMQGFTLSSARLTSSVSAPASSAAARACLRSASVFRLFLGEPCTPMILTILNHLEYLPELFKETVNLVDGVVEARGNTYPGGSEAYQEPAVHEPSEVVLRVRGREADDA